MRLTDTDVLKTKPIRVVGSSIYDYSDDESYMYSLIAHGMVCRKRNIRCTFLKKALRFINGHDAYKTIEYNKRVEIYFNKYNASPFMMNIIDALKFEWDYCNGTRTLLSCDYAHRPFFEKDSKYYKFEDAVSFYINTHMQNDDDMIWIPRQKQIFCGYGYGLVKNGSGSIDHGYIVDNLMVLSYE